MSEQLTELSYAGFHSRWHVGLSAEKASAGADAEFHDTQNRGTEAVGRSVVGADWLVVFEIEKGEFEHEPA